MNEKTGAYSLGDGGNYKHEKKTTHVPSEKPKKDPLTYIRKFCGKFPRPIAKSTELVDPITNLDVRLKSIESLFTTPTPILDPASTSPTSTSSRLSVAACRVHVRACIVSLGLQSLSLSSLWCALCACSDAARSRRAHAALCSEPYYCYGDISC